MNAVLRGIGIALGLLLILVATLAAFQLPVLPSLNLLLDGAFGDRFAWGRTGVKATPLLLTGLGMVVAWRAGMYNIGGEGQFVVGGIFGAFVGKLLLESPLANGVGGAFVLVACVAGGAAWAWIAAWLYLKRGVEVVIGTILLNFIALQILGWMCSGPLQEKSRALPQTDLLPKAMMLWKPDRQMDVNLGLGIALAGAIGVWLFLFRTRPGYRLRLVGENRNVARVNHIDPGKVQLRAMAISGGLCGLAGGIEYLGVAGQIQTSFAQSWGFLGIPVALLANLHPLGAIPAAAYFGALFAGSENLGRFTQSGPTLVYVIQAVAVLGFVFIGTVRRRRRKVVAA